MKNKEQEELRAGRGKVVVIIRKLRVGLTEMRSGQ